MAQEQEPGPDPFLAEDPQEPLSDPEPTIEEPASEHPSVELRAAPRLAVCTCRRYSSTAPKRTLRLLRRTTCLSRPRQLNAAFLASAHGEWDVAAWAATILRCEFFFFCLVHWGSGLIASRPTFSLLIILLWRFLGQGKLKEAIEVLEAALETLLFDVGDGRALKAIQPLYVFIVMTVVVVDAALTFIFEK